SYLARRGRGAVPRSCQGSRVCMSGWCQGSQDQVRASEKWLRAMSGVSGVFWISRVRSRGEVHYAPAPVPCRESESALTSPTWRVITVQRLARGAGCPDMRQSTPDMRTLDQLPSH